MTTPVFDPALHRYTWEGRVLPGVTTILRLSGVAPVNPWWTNADRQRGTDAHEACEAVDAGYVSLEDVPEEIAPRVTAWLKFLGDSNAAVVEAETPLCDPALGYCGTPDRVVTIAGAEFVVDLKLSAGTPLPSWALQLAAYRGLYDPERSARMGRISVQLLDTGAYRATRYEDHRGDWAVFRACLSVVTWRVAHGLDTI